VTLLLFALAEASVIEPLLLLVPSPLRLMDPGAALGVTWLLLSAIAFLRRWLGHRDVSAVRQRLILGSWLVGMLIVSRVIVNTYSPLDTRSLSIIFVEFFGVLLVWWRGMALGLTSLGPDAARLRLQIGLLCFIMFAVATVFNPTNNLISFILPFLTGAVFAMPLAHIDHVEQSEDGRPVPLDGKWWRGLGLGVGIPLLACMAVAVLVTGDVIGSGLRLLIAIVLLPVLVVAFVFGYLLTLIASLLFSGIKRNPLELLQNLGAFLQPLQQQAQQNTAAGIEISPELRYAIGLAVLAIIIAIVILQTARARREAAIVRVENDNLLDLSEDEPPFAPFETSILNTFNLRRWLAAVTIRRIYARLCHEAGKRGQARRVAQTPTDYQPQLVVAFPGADADLHIITTAYIAAHYGEVPDTTEALNVIRDAWERVRAVPREKKSPEVKGKG
jgi:hypothetical protein